MEEFAIICVDDERDVLDALRNDLEKFSRHFRIEPAESAKDAMSLLDELQEDDVEVALVLADHLMPGMSGVDFLIGLKDDKRTAKARKVLITAQAGLDATIEAVNKANLDHYIRKPWTREELHETIEQYLTAYVIEHAESPLRFSSVLDAQKLMDATTQRDKFGSDLVD